MQTPQPFRFLLSLLYKRLRKTNKANISDQKQTDMIFNTSSAIFIRHWEDRREK